MTSTIKMLKHERTYRHWHEQSKKKKQANKRYYKTLVIWLAQIQGDKTTRLSTEKTIFFFFFFFFQIFE